MKFTDIKAFSEKMNNELRERKPGIFSEKVYSDEPIIRSASSLENYEPTKYSALSRLRFDGYSKGWSTERIFYEQAKLAENFEDTCEYKTPFLCFMPTYSSLSSQQLRGYFTCRADFRKGIIKSAPVAYACIYMYELINQIGVESPEDGFFKLKNFGEAFSEYAPEVKEILPVWLCDYIAFYNLDLSVYSEYVNLPFEESVSVLENCNSVKNDKLFSAVKYLSAYNVSLSDFYKAYPEEYEFAMCKMYRNMSEKYIKSTKKDFTRKLFGKTGMLPYTVFGSAVFYNRKSVPDHICEINSLCRYEFKDGECYSNIYQGKKVKNYELGEFIRYFEAKLREAFGFNKLHYGFCPLKSFEKVTEKTVCEVLDYYNEKKRIEKLKFVDVSQLENIMHSADITREKLITDEEKETEIPTYITEEDEKEENGLLTQIEKGFINCLINKGDIKKYIKENSLKESLIGESINGKFYYIIGDTVLDTLCSPPELIEDYIEDIKTYLS